MKERRRASRARSTLPLLVFLRDYINKTLVFPDDLAESDTEAFKLRAHGIDLKT